MGKKLSAGGSDFKCGWLKDKYGLSWQIVPTVLPKPMANFTGRVMWIALGLRQPAILALATTTSFSGELRA
jgi:predicted 3-demethylubiquinone-9 3-methyltransferase (glyoxalase superfamily)